MSKDFWVDASEIVEADKARTDKDVKAGNPPLRFNRFDIMRSIIFKSDGSPKFPVRVA